MGRFFIDNEPHRHGNRIRFRVLIEENDTALDCTYKGLAQLLGVDSVDPADVKEGTLFESGDPKPAAHLTAERKALLEQLLSEATEQILGLIEPEQDT